MMLAQVLDPQTAIASSGEWVYELYSVMVHSGSAMGGHYYAYIKDLDSKKVLQRGQGEQL
jgi:ubiquitin C-terminal hydrolase